MDVTLVITSCNRPFLLDKTLESFIKYNTYPIYETIIVDDSGIIGCNDSVIEKYRTTLNIKHIYNEQNIGQIASIDKAYSLVKTSWIFHCEEDWEFLQLSFIEKSFKVFEENPNENIFTVWLRPHNDTSGHPIDFDSLNHGYYRMSKNFSYMLGNIIYTWGGITFNPGLRKTDVCMKFHPYSEKCKKFIHNEKQYIGEYEINVEYTNIGYYSMILSDPNGHVKHIGWGSHIMRPWDT
jgi:hypothetical protein